MFTGLVEGLASIHALTPEPPGLRIVVTPPPALADAHVSVGDSIALNGCCLTAVASDSGVWSFQAGPETLAKTNLGRLQVGDVVNVERPLAIGGRLGGHFVQGHVDGTGQVEQVLREADWVTMWFRVSEELAEEMVPKGSIAVDGVSLTLVDVEATRFSVALIPHTLEVTTLGRRALGNVVTMDVVNIETDILAKYVRKLLGQFSHRREAGDTHAEG